VTTGTVKLTRKMTSRAPVSGTRFPAKVGAFLGSPIALASSIVCLVATVGIVSTLSTYQSLRSIGVAHERASVAARTREIRASLHDAFSVADPILGRLEPAALRAGASADPAPLLVALLDVAIERRGLTWASVSYPDGTFVGVHYEPAAGGFVGIVSRTTDSTEVRYSLGGSAPRELGRSASGYDPRSRSFYTLAAASPASIWTDPYPFLPDLHTGVTRARALRRGGELAAVITADFDASELAKLLGAPLTGGERTVVAIGDAVLTVHGVRMPAADRLSARRAFSLADLDDPVLTRAHRARGARIEVDDETYRLSRATVGSLSGRPIELLVVVPESELYAHAIAEAKSGMLATAIVAFLGLLFATLLSANVALLRRRREQAEIEAARARAEVESLGSYELGQRIGSGGMGEVYRARHRLLARDAAVKVIKVEGDDDVDGSMRRFFDEARTLASLRSLHTVAVYDFGVAVDGRYFLAMELLLGLDLDTLVRRYGRQPPARVAAILAQVCDSLAEAHGHGFVHQDVKPANVFLCRLAESLDFVKVLDFGLTRAIGRRLADGQGVEGTPAFMAPEQAMGEALSYATDLYAVGCVGYFLLAAKLPYAATDSDAYMRAHVSMPVPALPDDVLATTPPALVQILTRCLAKDPKHRPISATALAHVLRRIARDTEASFPETELRAFWDDRARLDAIEAASPSAPAESGTIAAAARDPARTYVA